MISTLNLKAWHSIVALPLFCILATLGMVSCADNLSLVSPPIVKHIDLTQEGVAADFDFRVTAHDVYYFSILFKYPSGNRDEKSRIRKIIGGYELDKNGNPKEPGNLTPISLEIYKVNTDSKLIVYKKTIIPILTGWSDGSFTKIIGRCNLVTGEYKVVLKSLKHAKEYESISTSFVIDRDKYKSSFDTKKIDRSKTCPQ